MRTSPFLMGQLLGLADTLHKEYCIHVRKGQIPPQLIGNAAMAVALNNPAAALARLSERVIPYQAWAILLLGTVSVWQNGLCSSLAALRGTW